VKRKTQRHKPFCYVLPHITTVNQYSQTYWQSAQQTISKYL